MLYPYFSFNRGGEARLLPLIPISIRGPKGTLDNALALVDSGAEQNVFGGDVAASLGIRLEDGDEALITGVSGEPLVGRRVEVDLRLGRQLWRAPVIFVPELDRQLILGQAGFFAFFAVTFRYRMGRMDIRRAR